VNSGKSLMVGLSIPEASLSISTAALPDTGQRMKWEDSEDDGGSVGD
jgi:hypothetical protein